MRSLKQLTFIVVAIVLGATSCGIYKRKKERERAIRNLNGCCFSKGTKILLSDGTEKTIETIKTGDLILNVGLNTLGIQKDRVTGMDSVIHTNMIELALENNIRVKSTADHPYYIEGKGWCSFDPKNTYANYGITARVLKTGDLCLVYSNGSLSRVMIRAIRPIKGPIMTYNISGLAHEANYFANGILVSNETETGHITKK